MLGASAYGVLQPTRLVALVQALLTDSGLWAAAAMRLALALMLWFAAPGSRTPLAFQVLAVLMLLAGALLPVLGLARLRALMARGAALPPPVLRLLSSLGLVFGGFVLWSLWPPGASA